MVIDKVNPFPGLKARPYNFYRACTTGRFFLCIFFQVIARTGYSEFVICSPAFVSQKSTEKT